MGYLREVVSLFVTVGVLAAPIPFAYSYQAVTVGDGGTIKGKVVFQGSPPPMKKIIPTKDQHVCGGIREEPQIVLAPDKGVQDVIVYLKKVEKGKAWVKPTKTPELNNLKCRFEPYVQAVPVGSELEIVNSDPVLHNTHGFYDRRTAFNVAMPKQGERVKSKLERPGLVRVECDAHGWMRGWIYVADNPYYAITSKDGTFTIADVPPGTYTLVTWQEYTGAMEIPVTVKGKEVVPVTVELKKK